MPPVHEDKKYCIRSNCPSPYTDTIEAFSNGVRDIMLMMRPYETRAIEHILEQNGYQCVPVEDTTNFERG